jgi:3-oxoacyl-[acyl-carrier protein] reductase
MSFESERVLVTGASRGIGAAVADAFAAHGARVVGTATTAAGAQAVSERLAASGGHGEVLDVASTDSVQALFERLEAAGETPGIVVNNAGITRDNLLARMKDDEWNAVIETNLSSLYRVCKAASRSMMKARSGRIVNIGSVVGATGNPGQSNYAAAKAGMIGFTRALARELGARSITVNAVAPGFIDTDMTRSLADSQREQLLARIPLKRLGDPADVAAAVLFLCSPQAAYITGETLHVNGGMYMG